MLPQIFVRMHMSIGVYILIHKRTWYLYKSLYTHTYYQISAIFNAKSLFRKCGTELLSSENAEQSHISWTKSYFMNKIYFKNFPFALERLDISPEGFRDLASLVFISLVKTNLAGFGGRRLPLQSIQKQKKSHCFM